jgi:hypothetical protein
MPEKRTKDAYEHIATFISENELGFTEAEESLVKAGLKKLLIDTLEKKKGSAKKGSAKKGSAKKGSAKKAKKVSAEKGDSEDAYDSSKSYTVIQLKAFCKNLGLPVSGKKDDLTARLSEDYVAPKKERLTGKSAKSSADKSSADKEEKKKDAKKKKVIKEKEVSGKKILAKNSPEIIVKKNSSGLVIHEDTLTVWDKDIGKVIGYVKNIDDCAVFPLTTGKIEQCRQHGLEYILPDNIECDNSDDDEDDDASMAVLQRLKLNEAEDAEEDEEGEEA